MGSGQLTGRRPVHWRGEDERANGAMGLREMGKEHRNEVSFQCDNVVW